MFWVWLILAVSVGILVVIGIISFDDNGVGAAHYEGKASEDEYNDPDFWRWA